MRPRRFVMGTGPMPTRDDAPPEAPSERDHDNLVRLHGVTWAQYKMVAAIRGEHTAPRASPTTTASSSS